MITLRQFSVLAITALLITGISGVSTVAGKARVATTSTSLTSLITSLINSVGDDTFSIIDLTTLVSTLTPVASTPLHSSTLAARTQLDTSSSGTSTTHYGPFASTSPDSGTCGNDWATDTFDRHFTVFQNRDDGSLLVVEQFKDGSFGTSSGYSPGGCQSGPPAGTVASGITGSMHGYFVIPLPAGESQSSFDTHCNGTTMTNTGCNTTTFINTHFSPACYSSTCTVTTFFFHYTAGGQGLIINEWKNASADRGGNSGDIRSANI